MGMTMTQKILARHAGLSKVKPGELIDARIDLALGNDITAPVAIDEFEKAGIKNVFNREKIALVLDHFTPCKDIRASELCMRVRKFAKEHDIVNFFDVGEMGVEHALIPEKGLAAPGELIIGADSHTCTYGALNAFATGVGSTDLAAGMATGRAWFKVPGAYRFKLSGALKPWVSGKDLILHIIGMIGVDGALYRSMEFGGEGVSALGMDDRFTVSNMAIECGAKNAVFPMDAKTREYMSGRAARPYEGVSADGDAEYEREYEIDLSSLEPTVAFPFLPGNARTLDGQDVSVDQVVIGSCTNGRISDMRAAAKILKGRKVARGVRAIVIPATQNVYLEMLKEGLAEIFVEAGCALSTPTCGPCLGGHMGILGPGERCVSTTNRNFVGRMGHVRSEVYLASPAVAAASAVEGRLASPQKYYAGK